MGIKVRIGSESMQFLLQAVPPLEEELHGESLILDFSFDSRDLDSGSILVAESKWKSMAVVWLCSTTDYRAAHPLEWEPEVTLRDTAFIRIRARAACLVVIVPVCNSIHHRSPSRTGMNSVTTGGQNTHKKTHRNSWLSNLPVLQPAMFVKFSRAVVLGIAYMMLASYTEDLLSVSRYFAGIERTSYKYFSGKPGTSITVDCQTCFCQKNGVRQFIPEHCFSHRLTGDRDAASRHYVIDLAEANVVIEISAQTEGLIMMFSRVSILFGMLVFAAFVSANPLVSKPGTRFGPCNNCICTESGEIACTNVACPPNRRRLDSTETAVQEEYCRCHSGAS
ncbi:hypothetical protein C8R45DRAFT_1084104 [Mycena sanguinolenta]|nr:hypothetical protein C8R45DRAFT_1084104 [Mycena sanguinolenta]